MLAFVTVMEMGNVMMAFQVTEPVFAIQVLTQVPTVMNVIQDIIQVLVFNVLLVMDMDLVMTLSLGMVNACAILGGIRLLCVLIVLKIIMVTNVKTLVL